MRDQSVSQVDVFCNNQRVVRWLPDSKSNYPPMPPTPGLAVAVDRLTVTLQGHTILDELSFACRAGEFVAIVGPSGCGKSTLLRSIAGLQPVSSSAIQLDAQPLTVTSHTQTSYVFQEPALLPWRNVRDNIALPLELRGVAREARYAAAAEASKRVGLQSSDMMKLPRMLSGGMRMRTSLARAIVTRPRLMLLDEPLAAVDDVLREQLLNELLLLWANNHWTGIFVTHNVAEAAFISQRVLVMRRHPGQIAKEIPIPFPYPREMDLRDDPEFARVTGRIRKALRESTT
jgi:NitT/TauT family transport system ATP-binding protein